MRLARLGDRGREKPVLITDEAVYDLSGIVSDLDPTSIADGAIDRIRAAAEAGGLPKLRDATAARIGSPIGRPATILCIGLNYAAHAAESGAAPPSSPVLFLKTPNTVGGPNDRVDVPRTSTKTDWEVELGVVIGKRALYLDSPTDSAAHIAGYVAANDLSERAFQLEVSGGQWSKGKSAPGFTPLGPWLVTPDEVDTGNLRLRSWVNGEPRQDSSTSDLIFSVEYIIWHLSQFLALEPGDVVLTGTPEGVALSGRFPYITAGDVVEIEIEGLGRQRQEFGQA
ncbi:fumarylacetoacetate hydrolase family protein [uncultured Microbacterium sp.]|uniref:fumarylacetoacetate hydrolase family protein n=1 Tax=uncultured Microbacterium sp. TaxID=191216 RepID=UPI0035CC2C24